MKHASFILIEQVKDQRVDKNIIRKRLERREDYWILTLNTMIPNGLNHQLNNT